MAGNFWWPVKQTRNADCSSPHSTERPENHHKRTSVKRSQAMYQRSERQWSKKKNGKKDKNWFEVFDDWGAQFKVRSPKARTATKPSGTDQRGRRKMGSSGRVLDSGAENFKKEGEWS